MANGMCLFLGLDVGTSGTKALLYDAASHTVVGRGVSDYGILPTDTPSRAEQDPATWIQAVISATKEALAGVDPGQVRGVGVSGQQHGLVVLDADNQVLRPAKLWCDSESAAEAEELSQLLGWKLVPSFTATKLLWLKRHEPQVFERVAHVLLPHDYVNWWLTERHVMEYGDASGTGVFDSAAQQWDPCAMAAVDERLATWLPPLVGPDEVIGTLRAEAAEQLGLPPGVAVSPGSGDNAMSALGAGVVSSGQLVCSLGTSGTLFGKSDEPVLDSTGAICPFCDATGAWLPLLCTLNCTRALEEVCEAFGLGHQQLTELAELEAPGCGGVSMLPYFIGERTPCWPHASGAIVGLRPGGLRPGLLYRAALEGATLGLLAGLRRVMALAPRLEPSELRLVGGGSRSRLWRQVVADAFQVPVVLPAERDSAALGAALQAAACVSGVPVADYVRQHPPPLLGEAVLPNPEHAAAYEEGLKRHQQYGHQLFAHDCREASGTKE